MRVLAFIVTSLFFINYSYAKCAVKPSFMLDTEILSCKVVYFDDPKFNNAVLLNVKVNDELPFGTASPMNWDNIMKNEPYHEGYSVKTKTIPLLFLDHEYSCFDARSTKLYSEGKEVFYVQSLCCDSASEICEQTNHIGYKPPNFWNRKRSFREFDPTLDFNEHDVIKEQ